MTDIIIANFSSPPDADWAGWARAILLLAFLVPAAIIDYRTEKVPNKLSLPAVLVGLIFAIIAGAVNHTADQSIFMGGLQGFADSFAGLMLGFIPLFIIFILGGIRGGDVKTMAAIGSISANVYVLVYIMFWGFVATALIGIFVMFRHGIAKRTFGRIFTAILTLGSSGVTSEEENEEDIVRIPYAVGFFFGACIGGLPILLGFKVPLA